MNVNDIIIIAYEYAQKAYNKSEKLDKEMEHVMIGAFEKEFKNLNSKE